MTDGVSVYGLKVIVVDIDDARLDFFRTLLDNVTVSFKTYNYVKDIPLTTSSTDNDLIVLSGDSINDVLSDLTRIKSLLPSSSVVTVSDEIEKKELPSLINAGADYTFTRPVETTVFLHIMGVLFELSAIKRENINLSSTISLFNAVDSTRNDEDVAMFIDNLGHVLMKEIGADSILFNFFDDYADNLDTGSTVIIPNKAEIPEYNIDEIKHFLSDYGDIFISYKPPLRFFDRFPERLVSLMLLPLMGKSTLIGFVAFHSYSKKNLFKPSNRRLFDVFSGYLARSVENIALYNGLMSMFEQTIQGFARALEAKDTYTQGHSERVAEYALMMAIEMGLPKKELDIIKQAGILHDIGKIGLTYEGLNKAGKLTDEEWNMFRQHPVIGKRIIEPITFLKPTVPLIYFHHEMIDGKGYPLGLKGNEIPEGARILAIADSYGAMTSDRSYRKALKHEDAIDEIKRCAGTQFDEKLVPYFISAVDKYRALKMAKGEPYPE